MHIVDYAVLSRALLKSHPVDGGAGVMDCAGLEPKFVDDAPPIAIRREVELVFVELAIGLDRAAGDALYLPRGLSQLLQTNGFVRV